MRPSLRVFPLVLCLLILPTIAAADSITSLSPSSFTQFSTEEFLTIDGSGFQGTTTEEVPTEVVFSSTIAGTVTIEPSVLSDTELIVAVPDTMLQSAGTVSVTVLAHDLRGTRTIGPATFTVNPIVTMLPPELNVPEAVVAEATSPAGANVTFSVTGFSFVDPPPAPTVVCNHNSGDLFPLGTTIVTCTATDSFGSSLASFPVVVTDTSGPVITVPADILTTNPVVTYSVTATDAIDGPVTVTCSPASGSTFPNGTTFVSCSATDDHANTSTATFRVSVNVTPPSLNLPGDLTVSGSGFPAHAVVNFTVTTDADATVDCDPPSGSIFFGTTTVNCTATNTGGGVTTGSFTVTVIGGDNTPPVLTLPADFSVEATGPSGATVTFTATAVDNVDGSVPVTCTPASGSLFPLGSTTVNCSASDLSGNVAHGSFHVVVVDTTPPVIVDATASPSNLWPPNHRMADITLTVNAVDTVDAAPTVLITSVSSNQPTEGTGDGDVPVDWVITGPLTLQLRAERSSGQDRTYTITFTVTDFSGNTTTGTVTVKVSQQTGGSSTKKRIG
jgi:hypothetical protein